MGLRIVLIVCATMFLFVGCSKDDVDSRYSFEVNNLKATVTHANENWDRSQILLDSLKSQEFIEQVRFSEQSRAENDRLAEERFLEKCKNVKTIKLDMILDLHPGESVSVSFDYILRRGREVLEQEKIDLHEVVPSSPVQ